MENPVSLFLSLLFPNCCPGCGIDLVQGEDIICLPCTVRMPRTEFERFRGNPIEIGMLGLAPVEAAMAGFFFVKGSILQKLLHALKYENRPDIGIMLGRRLGKLLADSKHDFPFDLIVPIPLHKRRETKRGYNQSLKIAEGISEVTGIAIDAESVVRNVYADSQTKVKGKLGRWDNVEEVFEVRRPDRLRGRNILVVDDVFTTGATATACMERIGQIPDTQLWFAAVATPTGA